LFSKESAGVQVYQLVSIHRAKQTLKSKEVSGRWSGFGVGHRGPMRHPPTPFWPLGTPFVPQQTSMGLQAQV